MAEGTVDIRTRENQRLGKMRIDKLHEYFQSLMPAKSKAYSAFYEKAWDPACFEQKNLGNFKEGVKEDVKLYVREEDNHSRMVQIVAKISGVNVQIVKTTENSKSVTGGFPYLETKDGSIIGESEAICKHIARMNLSSGLLGAHQMDHAKINEWITWTQCQWIPKSEQACRQVYGTDKTDMEKFNQSVKVLKEQAKILDSYLKNKKWLNNVAFSLADIYVGMMVSESFQLLLDGGFRKAMPNLTKWFDAFCLEPSVSNVVGVIYPCAKAMKPAGDVKPVAAAPNKKETPAPKAAEKKEDDLDDLFGDSNPEEEAAAKAAAEAAAKAKKPKKTEIAQSLVLFEVKPLSDETDLDAMAKKILEIKQDGLYWKTEYKKEPVAFGIYKIVIGVTVEDEKVSVDDIQEKIEAIDDMVQSVEIAAFNKI